MIAPRPQRPIETGEAPFMSVSPFPLRHRAYRALWNAVWLLLAAWTPPRLRDWRVFLLRAFGARIGPSSDVRGSARIWYPAHLTMAEHSIIAEGVICYNMAAVSIGRYCIISQRAVLCGGTHDYSEWHHPLVTKPITIGDHAWICSEAFVGPGAVIGEGVVLGARAVATGRLDPWGIYAGNPGLHIRERHMKPAEGER